MQHKVPDPMELQYTRLIDPRWIEAFVGKLKEADDYLERRKKLSGKSAAAPTSNPGGVPKAAPKGGPKGKGKKGSNQEENATE